MAGLTRAVRDYRMRLMGDFMRVHGFDALAFSGADWFEWASNHPMTDQAWERPYLVVISANGTSFALMSELGRLRIAAESARGTSWLDSVTYYGESPDNPRTTWLLPVWHEMLVETLRLAGLERSRIGVDVLGSSWAAAVRALPALSVASETEKLRALRWIKHPEEIETMRTAASLSEWAMGVMREAIRPGRLVSEVDYLVTGRLAVEAASRLPNENFLIGKIQTLSGPSSASPHGDGALTAKVFEKDGVSVSVITTRLNGIATELARPWLVGSPDAHIIALFECALTAQRAAMDAAVAGKPVCGMHAAARRVVEQAGFGDLFGIRSSHGIGVVMHDFPHDAPFVKRELLEREVYVVEPGLYAGGIGGFRFADAVVIQRGAPDMLSSHGKDRSQQTLP